MIATQCSRCGAHNALDVTKLGQKHAEYLGVAGLCRYCAFRAAKDVHKKLVQEAADVLGQDGILQVWSAAAQILMDAPTPKTKDDDQVVGVSVTLLRALAKVANIGCFTIFEATNE